MQASAIFIAKSDAEFNAARSLFQEYAAALGIDLCFQHFDDELGLLQIVVAAPHSALRSKNDQTPRMLNVVNTRGVNILGHPRGRIYNFRKGLTADWSQVCNLAAELDKAVEIDCYPDRQDLNIELLKVAKAAGCRISLGTDSHDPSQLGFIDLGLAAALWSGIQPERILNFMPLNQLSKWIANIR